MIEPRIEILSEKKVIGMNLTMTLAKNNTFALWSRFMPRRKEIKNNENGDLISMQVYPPIYDFVQFDFNTPFQKWAAIEVYDFNNVPNEMETFIIPSGLYAVFHYIGMNTDTEIFRYIFSEWLPNSVYSTDCRPHFEILGEKYKNNDPNSEEEIWVPIITKK